MSYGSMLHIPPTNCLLLTAKQEPYKKAYLFTKNIEEFSGKKFRRKDQQAEHDKTERVTGLGRRTRERGAKIAAYYTSRLAGEYGHMARG